MIDQPFWYKINIIYLLFSLTAIRKTMLTQGKFQMQLTQHAVVSAIEREMPKVTYYRKILTSFCLLTKLFDQNN